jgi:hypothetical protein
MTEMEEVKTMLTDINKKLDRVILQNKIAMNTKYGSPVKQEKDSENVIKVIRHQAITDFLYFVKHKEVGVHAPVIKTFVTSYERLLKLLEEFEFNEAHMQDL